MKRLVTAFYNFASLTEPEVAALEAGLHSLAAKQGISGLIVLATEGVNGTVAGPEEGIGQLESYLRSHEKLKDVLFKRSWANSDPFRRFRIKIRPEIVTLGTPELLPDGPHGHLTPKEWDEVLQSDEDYVVIDTRNTYETALGMFKGAIDPEMDKFTEFKDYIQNCGIPKDKKVLMYCTGGIRCEKASLEMERAGYENVYQLEGGILKYLEEIGGDGEYEGECFVFDHRVSVDGTLEPSKRYHLCPICGDPGDRPVSCCLCGKDCVVCKDCPEVCSKNCNHHRQRKADTSAVSS